MSWQSTLEQAKSVHLSRNTVIGIGVGIVIGLTLGLLIGWVWWPVEWQGPADAVETAASPALGTSQFETPEAKALYLGAVADAFVYASAAGDADAASVAAQRLAALGGDMRAAFNNAIDYYNAQAGGATRVNNLTTLAMTVGIPLGAPADTGADTAALATSDNAAQPPAGTPADDAGTGTGSSTGSAGWLLTLITALILIGGGAYILWTLKRRQDQVDSTDSGFIEEDLAPAPTPITPAFERDSLTPVRPGLTPAASIRSSVERPGPSQAGGPHGFEADDFEDYDNSDDEPEEEFDQRAHYRTVSEETANTGDAARQPDRHAAPPTGFVTSVGAPPPVSGPRTVIPDEQMLPEEDDETVSPPPPVRAPPPPPSPPTPSRFERYTPVESYTANYYIGRIDFDHTKNVQNPNGSGYIGEYGIGIPEKRGLLHNDLEKAIAIEVYLFDKTDERQMLTVTRSLLSLYADDHKRAEFEREKQSLAPIVAQPNTNFQLEGRQLLLDCLIKHVEYTPEGYFQNVTVELVLKRKN